ncbi:AAA family ATPase [uncultured Mailhella sp.]|uniref:McrB family protein n=1 Tax=uncultured Mailhella sp. TaxID=1981031 RepID=UPI0026019F1F|nr:AAA family ATPase [uncultured Mailhella sp.]
MADQDGKKHNGLEFLETKGYSEKDIPLNLILYGPPGTGKTYWAMLIADVLIDGNNPKTEEEKKNYKKFVTFHQSFSYEYFVEGIHAETEQGGISYEIRDGIFKALCDTARNDAENKYVIIIDEINRGNISAIFGELITLIEAGKRGKAGEKNVPAVCLPYSSSEFSVPKNVYIIGTMNTADRSLTGLDIALRRRFEFVEVQPEPELLNTFEDGEEIIINEEDHIKFGNILETINKRIEILQGRDHTIGHSYFMDIRKCKTEQEAAAFLARVFTKNIIPLLREYFFDDWEKIRMVLNDAEGNFIKKDSVDEHLFSEEFNENINKDRIDKKYTINDDLSTESIDVYGKIVDAEKKYKWPADKKATSSSNDSSESKEKNGRPTTPKERKEAPENIEAFEDNDEYKYKKAYVYQNGEETYIFVVYNRKNCNNNIRNGGRYAIYNEKDGELIDMKKNCEIWVNGDDRFIDLRGNLSDQLYEIQVAMLNKIGWKKYEGKYSYIFND